MSETHEHETMTPPSDDLRARLQARAAELRAEQQARQGELQRMIRVMQTARERADALSAELLGLARAIGELDAALGEAPHPAGGAQRNDDAAE